MPNRLLRNAARRFARRDDTALLDPALVSSPEVAEPALAVADVVTVEPVEKTYRAVVTRTVTQTALVEFVALEGTDTMTMAQGLLETIPPESWVTQPAESWGYIDTIEEVGAVADVGADPADPLAAPDALSRRRRRSLARRFARKAAFDVSVDGVLFGTYDAETAEDAILAYVAEAGYATVDEAAAAAGMTAEDFLASVTATEALVALDDETIPEDDELPPETLARRRRSRRASKLFTDDNSEGFSDYDLQIINEAVTWLMDQGIDEHNAHDIVNNAWYEGVASAAELLAAAGYATLDDDSVEEEEDELPPETLARRRALGFGRRSRRYACRMDAWEITAAIDEITRQVHEMVGFGSIPTGANSYEEALSNLETLKSYLAQAQALAPSPDDPEASTVQASIDQLVAWIDGLIIYAEEDVNLDWQALDETLPVEEDEIPPETLARRRRRAA